MSNYDDDQSEDGELARSPVHDEMDFSLSDEDRDNADSLVIKPPQAVIRTSHREKRGHKRSGKERYKDVVRKEKKHFYRERDKPDKPKHGEVKSFEREDISKEYYREKQYYREKDSYREKEIREKELYREREMYREKDVYREKDPYRDRDHYREREMYRDNTSFREAPRQREMYREKEIYKEKDVHRDREMYLNRDRQNKYSDNERKRERIESDRIESRMRLIGEESRSNHNNEKENRDKTSGDKELEDLRTRLLSKRISKELHETKKQVDYTTDKDFKSDERQRHSSSLDRHQQERRKKLLEAEREIEKRKHESRNELEARREERRRRGKKRSVSPEDVSNKKKRDQSPNYDSVVTVSDASDIEMKSDSIHSEPEDGENTNSETDEGSTTESDSDVDSKSGDDDCNEERSVKEDKDAIDENNLKTRLDSKSKSKSKSPSPKSVHRSPSSHRSHSRSKSRSRSHSFSPPPPGENGKTSADEEKVEEEDDEKLRLKEEAINSLPPYFPALQGCRSVEEFQCLNRIEEGTYGVVYRARDKTTDEIVALKRLKMEKEKEGFPITSLREINTLLKARHLLPEEGCARGVTPLQGLTTSIHGRA